MTATPRPKKVTPDAGVPLRYRVVDDGVHVTIKRKEEGVWKEKEEWLCSPLQVVARTRDENGENAGLLLEFRDMDGKPRRSTISRSLLARDPSQILEELFFRNFPRIASWYGARGYFRDYLMSAKPEKVVRNTSRIGWHGESYVLPNENVGEAGGEETILQSNSNDYRLTVKGTLKDWQENVGRHCEANSRLLFAASVGFAGPLLRPLGQEGGGFHLRSNSSKGKSTSTIVAGSVYGGGDPKHGYGRTWLNTTNALEATAEMHNDGLLVLDEIALCDAREVGNTAYMLSSGVGKGRLDSSIKMRRPFQWQLMFLSSGEISLADHALTVGKRTRAGQEVRLIDLPADTGVNGVFEDLHGYKDGAEFAKTLQHNAKTYYGSPLRAYLAGLTRAGWDTQRNAFSKYEKAFTDEALKDTGEVSGEISRVVSRFALVAYAGDLATNMGVTGWARNSAWNSSLKLFGEWLESRGGTGNMDEEAAVAQVRRFIAEYGSTRFESTHKEQHIVNGVLTDLEQLDNHIHGKRAGFTLKDKAEEEKLYCIFPDVFKSEVCSGYDSTMVAKALHARDLLIKGADGKFSRTERSPMEKKNRRMYVIKEGILE
jgi:putative DNA primase/helicase